MVSQFTVVEKEWEPVNSACCCCRCCFCCYRWLCWFARNIQLCDPSECWTVTDWGWKLIYLTLSFILMQLSFRIKNRFLPQKMTLKLTPPSLVIVYDAPTQQIIFEINVFHWLPFPKTNESKNEKRIVYDHCSLDGDDSKPLSQICTS